MKLIRISAIWCPACIIMRPKIEEIIKKYNFESIELDYDIDDVLKYNVDILPVFILEDNNKELVRIIGEKDIKELENIIQGVLK